MNTRIAHWVDNQVGFALCVFLHFLNKITQVFKRANVKKDILFSNALIIKFWGIGSIILTIPALTLFKEKNPGVKITFVTLEQNRDVCEMIESIDFIETIDLQKDLLTFFKQTILLIIKLRKIRFDLAVDLEFFTKFSAIFIYFVKAKVKVGFFDRISWRGRLHDTEIPFNSYWHVAENFINALISLKTKLDYIPMPHLLIAKKEEKEVLNLLSKLGIDNQKDRLLVINPNAGEMVLLRRWPKDHFVQLIKKLLGHDRIKIALIGSSKEKSYVQGIINEVYENNSEVLNRLFNLSGLLSVKRVVSLLAESRLFITNDSGPFHLTVAVNTPTISFFGPETPILYGSLKKNDKVFFKNISCSPCINVYNNKRPICRHKSNICLEMISVDEVYQEVIKRLKDES